MGNKRLRHAAVVSLIVLSALATLPRPSEWHIAAPDCDVPVPPPICDEDGGDDGDGGAGGDGNGSSTDPTPDDPNLPVPGRNVIGLAAAPFAKGYWLATDRGLVYAFGAARWHGSMRGERLSSPITAIAATPSGNGYWLAAANGDVISFGDAVNLGSASRPMDKPIVAIAGTSSGSGYWLAATNGDVIPFGDAINLGSANRPPDKPIAAIAPTPSGNGYWLAATNGDILPFGDAPNLGSTSRPLDKPIVAIAPTPSGSGYWLAATNGEVLPFGDAAHMGSQSPGPGRVVDIAASPTGEGYWLAVSTGQVLATRNARFHGQPRLAGTAFFQFIGADNLFACLWGEAVGPSAEARLADPLSGVTGARPHAIAAGVYNFGRHDVTIDHRDRHGRGGNLAVPAEGGWGSFSVRDVEVEGVWKGFACIAPFSAPLPMRFVRVAVHWLEPPTGSVD